jgi:hypothetical protein
LAEEKKTVSRVLFAFLPSVLLFAACYGPDGPPPRDEGLAGDPLSAGALLDGGSSGFAGAKAGDNHAPAMIGARHVLIQWIGSQSAGPAVVRTRAQALTVAEEVLRRARAGEDLGQLAVEFSDEPNAASRGGSLGRFPRGQMVRPFEDAAFNLKVGEISGIVETPFGFHIIQRTS